MRIARQDRPGAFTLVELLVVIAVIAVMASLLLPALLHAQQRARQTECINNLKQIVMGFRNWASDNEDRFPWTRAPRLLPGQGPAGEATGPASGNTDSGVEDVAEYFRVISNELVTPKVLTCPADRKRTPAVNWLALEGGRNLSYFIGEDSLERYPQTLVTGDRNVFGSEGGTRLAFALQPGKSIDAAWDRQLHRYKGNTALAGGSVHQTTTAILREQIATALATGSTNVVLLLPTDDDVGTRRPPR
jgi:prepilin-type N-terminal cleavage/methylation domain-containing protein